MLKMLYGVNLITILSGLMTCLTSGIQIWQAYSPNKKPPVLFSIITTIFLAISVALFSLGIYISISCNPVPNVVGLTIKDARTTLEAKNFIISLPSGVVSDERSDDYIVTGQSVQENEIEFKGKSIAVYVRNILPAPVQSQVSVPNVTGDEYSDAIDKLISANLRYIVSVSGTENAELNNLYVARQSIAAGNEVTEGSTIEIVLDAQKEEAPPAIPPATETIEVPSVITMTEQEAVEALESLGLKAQVWWLLGVSDSLNTYYIVSQSIPAGSIVPKGTLIQLERSGVKLGTPVSVPNVVGIEQNEATMLLTNLGLQFQVWWTEENNVSSEVYYIIDQSIPGGSTVPAGTLIRLELSPSKP